MTILPAKHWDRHSLIWSPFPSSFPKGSLYWLQRSYPTEPPIIVLRCPFLTPFPSEGSLYCLQGSYPTEPPITCSTTSINRNRSGRSLPMSIAIPKPRTWLNNDFNSKQLNQCKNSYSTNLDLRKMA